MPESNTTTMDDLMARVGYLLLNWGFFENALKRKKRSLASVQTLPGIPEARRIRNLIAHGIEAASADPTEGLAYLSCKARDEASERVTFDELGAAIEALEKAKIETLRAL